jgi:hypothetical protein
MFDRGVVHIVVAAYVVGLSYFRFKQRSGSYCCGWLRENIQSKREHTEQERTYRTRENIQSKREHTEQERTHRYRW